MNSTFDTRLIKKILSYFEYSELIKKLVDNGQTTGLEPTPERIEATKLNKHRMARLDRQTIVNKDLKEEMELLTSQWTWLILLESWCGDGAQNIPVINKIASCSPFVELKIILRDENPRIMDAFLTNGARAIPKLICYDSITSQVMGTWGPRPKIIAQMVTNFKNQNPNVSHNEFVKNLHTWYGKNKGDSLQQEFRELIKSWSMTTQLQYL